MQRYKWKNNSLLRENNNNQEVQRQTVQPPPTIPEEILLIVPETRTQWGTVLSLGHAAERENKRNNAATTQFQENKLSPPRTEKTVGSGGKTKPGEKPALSKRTRWCRDAGAAQQAVSPQRTDEKAGHCALPGEWQGAAGKGLACPFRVWRDPARLPCHELGWNTVLVLTQSLKETLN